MTQMTTINRGRPAGRMTPRRKAVLACIETYRERGFHVSLSRIARDCGLSHYRNARRIVDDLKGMGAL
jgi:AcrR family transcriptional regulator